jgi:transcriptional regulator with XRE-family HTH domain
MHCGVRAATAVAASNDAAMKCNRKPSAASLRLLATNLKRLRDARGYTQHQLARSSGLGQGYIGDLEREAVNCTLAILDALANGLECALYDLFAPLKKEGRP